MGARIPFTYYDRLVIIELWGCRCAYCDTALAQGDDDCDHVQPWSRGGAHALANVASSCRPCNNAKGTHSAAEIGRPEIVDAAALLALEVDAALAREAVRVRGVELSIVRMSRLVRSGWVLSGPTKDDR